MPLVQDDVLNALKQCYDPEIPVNIVDLGLIYEIRFAGRPPKTSRCDRRHDPDRPRLPGARQHQRPGKIRVEQLPGVRTPTSIFSGNPPGLRNG